MERIGDAGDELVTVLLEAGRGVIEVVVDGGEVGAEAVGDGQGYAGGEVCRVGVGVVESGKNSGRFGEDNLSGELAKIVFLDGGAD